MAHAVVRQRIEDMFLGPLLRSHDDFGIMFDKGPAQVPDVTVEHGCSARIERHADVQL